MSVRQKELIMANYRINERKCFSFTWAIENFSFCWQNNGEDISSPSFIVDTIERSKWKLVLRPNQKLSETNCLIICFLIREEDSKGPTYLTILFEVAFLNDDGSVLKSNGIYVYSFTRDTSRGFSEIFEKELLRSQKKQFLPNDILTVRCRIWKKSE
ncbi:speckle-type POZ protein [Trichonephila clavata]|uniref:Speckle-type POZ protein n=1 Tax=Trichonephila clavata TaxID=2740835 RepID=A0A8X6K7I6_TRICU|nr:speckle-type POZ protein [Trichonephila clavata]